MSSIADFVIQDGELKKYTGSERDVVIPDGVTSIGKDAFRDCDALTNITIPESVTSIGWNAFSGCRSLTSITIPEGVTSIGLGTFDGCRSLTSITIPEGVTSIGGYAFFGCSSLTNIVIPEGVTNIGRRAFSDCTSLRSVTMLGKLNADAEIFNGCMALESIDIRSPKTKFGANTFGDGYPPALIPQTEALVPHLEDSTIKIYFLPKNVWDTLSAEACAEIYLTHRKGAWTMIYDSLIGKETADAIGRAVAARTAAGGIGRGDVAQDIQFTVHQRCLQAAGADVKNQ